MSDATPPGPFSDSPARLRKPYSGLAVESRVRQFWADERVYERCKTKAQKGRPYFFLDGPPYTSGLVHLGTAWNKVLKVCGNTHLKPSDYLHLELGCVCSSQKNARLQRLGQTWICTLVSDNVCSRYLIQL